MKIKLLTLAILCTVTGQAQQRQETLLLDEWQFSHDKQSWETVNIPHDWAISGPFDKKWDLQVVAITQNGEKEATEKSGRSGSLPWIGDGYYKRNISIPSGFNGHAELVFDGAMAEPTVFINGQKAGYWPYGYNTFRIDVTPFVKPGDNLLEVNLRNIEESSRWYPGAGIYRPVKLVLTPTQTYIDDWSLYVHTVSIKEGKAVVEAEARVVNPQKGSAQMIIIGPDGNTITSGDIRIEADGKIYNKFIVNDPKLWTPETPHLYKVVARVYKEHHELLDEKMVNTGLRTVSVSKKGGFQLNGKTRKLKGVCLHHDLGPLGAAINKAALIRQIKTMKEMGCDAIRTAHNMPSQWQMDICDSLGMMVMAESFDMWIYPKCKNGYARFFKEWSDRDITNLVLANRNHPGIVMWSIGNEIPEQGMTGGRQMAAHLQDLCHQLDPTRPVTQGCDRPDNAIATGFLPTMDVPGLNYRLHRYQDTFNKLWQGYLLGSETASTVSSRGTYYFPVEPSNKNTHPDGQCSGYDVEWCPWSNLPDDDWQWQDDKDWVIGEFVWTGYDYLGEPTPYDDYWPSRSSYFGICDLAGLPKDRYYLYRSKWNKEQHTIHLLPHWTWPGREGEVTPVYCYTDYDEAELFVNGRSQGRIKKNPAERLDRYRLRWNNVKYEPGEVKVVVYDTDGQVAGTKSIKTAGKPSKIQADVWTQSGTTLKADGNDLAFVTISLIDNKGTFVPTATDQFEFEVTGAGTFKAVCNGDATSLEVFTKPTMKLFAGQLVVVVQAGKTPGKMTLKVSDPERHLKRNIIINVK
ncbi:MAG: DUF4982 domain-containing protein [Prevotella sp.]|nr:DUF4982 domain-containing protein [Prevotella sp.]